MAERRLIDAEALKRHYSWLGDTTTLTKKDVNDIVDVQPTVDAVTVVHGRWVVVYVDDGDVIHKASIEFYCSECGTEYGLESGEYGWTVDDDIPLEFCAMCGARMDGEGGEQK